MIFFFTERHLQIAIVIVINLVYVVNETDKCSSYEFPIDLTMWIEIKLLFYIYATVIYILSIFFRTKRTNKML